MDKYDAMDFVASFLAFVNTNGIYDEFDKESNKMITSSGVQALIEQAKTLLPEMKGGQTSKMMRELTDDERERAIVGNNRVIDMRAEFAKRIAANGGRQRLMSGFVEAMELGDFEKAKQFAEDAATLQAYDDGEG